MALLKQKIKATTLVETLIAMVIVMITFGLGLMIYVNVMNSGNQQLKLNAQLLMNQMAAETKTDNNFLDEEMETETLKIIKTVLPYEGSKRLNILMFEAFNKGGKKVTERKELIIVE
ncbi:MAG: hypothetical protein COA57_04870 [Flavobacteriales bacterium]|nr:MAG: hypothetical protein COA57_04870 [Flavobacteriales bacterium]